VFKKTYTKCAMGDMQEADGSR